MPNHSGSFHSNGSPALRIQIKGTFGVGEEFDAIIDTGFTGFVSMPMVDAFPLGLILAGTTTVVLADNSKQVRLTAFGNVGIPNGPSAIGIIILEWEKGDVLLGMQFLATAKKSLTVGPLSGTVVLADDVAPVAPALPATPSAPSPPDHQEPVNATSEDPQVPGDGNGSAKAASVTP